MAYSPNKERLVIVSTHMVSITDDIPRIVLFFEGMLINKGAPYGAPLFYKSRVKTTLHHTSHTPFPLDTFRMGMHKLQLRYPR